MKRSRFALACAMSTVVSLAAARQVDAATITFEDIAVVAGSNSIGGDRTSGGFLFDSSTDHTHLIHNSFDAYNNSTSLVTDNFNGQTTLTMSQVGGGLFSLQSLDIAEWFGSERALTVNVQGVGGAAPSMIITIDQIFDGAGALNDFQTVAFGAAWTNLSSVQFTVGSAFAGAGYFGLDNIVVNQAPEPALMLLLGTGALGAAIRRRRQTRG